MMLSGIRQITFLAILLCLMAVKTFAGETDQSQTDFLSEVFQGEKPEANILWITKDIRPGIKTILGRDPDVLRLRYWQKNHRAAWILEEIGKEEPITVGIVINRGMIESLKVLIYRESRGGEVRYPFFTGQFKGLSLDNKKELSRSIDGITGATLSVRALKKIAALALYLDGEVKGNNEKK